MDCVETPSRALTSRRVAGASTGLLVHLLFAVTVVYLYDFLAYGRTPEPNASGVALGIDAGLALLFAIPHSLILWPPTRKRLGRWISPAFYGLFYTTATCASLGAIFIYWRGVSPVLWELHGSAAAVVRGLFFASWAALFYSLHLTGLGYQTGLTPWLYWLAQRPAPRRTFTPRGAYAYLRHPVYVSFAGLVWFTPQMTLDHAVLTALWTCYLLIGSALKDRR
ncbi:MAG: hypothetical protein KDA61_17005, partial [Planctomycetales bacterium]|nr:hypothetical protein [Planctomycetales bacterium]